MDQIDAVHIRRYQLFPQLGLVLLLVPALRRWLRRLGPGPLARGAAVLVLAVALLALNLPAFRPRSARYDYPDQAPTLAAVERLAALARSEGIGRAQVLDALDPARPAWFPFAAFDFLAFLLPETADPPSCPPERVRPILLSGLSTADLGLLCGGMDATRQLIAVADTSGHPMAAIGRPTRRLGLRPAGGPDRFEVLGPGAGLEFDLGPVGDGSAAFLGLPTGPEPVALELWWSDRAGGWSRTRSVRWTAPASANVRAWAVPLGSIPHFDPAEARRVRVFPRGRGVVTLGAPRLLR